MQNWCRTSASLRRDLLCLFADFKSVENYYHYNYINIINRKSFFVIFICNMCSWNSWNREFNIISQDVPSKKFHLKKHINQAKEISPKHGTRYRSEYFLKYKPHKTEVNTLYNAVNIKRGMPKLLVALSRDAFIEF